MRQNLTGSAAPQADPAAHGRAVEAQALRDLQAALPTGWTLETSIILARGGDADALLITGNGERFALDVKARTDEMDLSAPKGDRAKSWAEIYEQVTLAARQLQAQGVVWQPRTKDTAFTPVGDLWAARGDARALVGALQERTTPQAAASTPHEVLEVSPTATLEDIKAAYRRLAKQYHPDRVASLGPEFRLLAEQRMKQINAAYEALTGR